MNTKHCLTKLLRVLTAVVLIAACLCGGALADDKPTPSPMPVPEGLNVIFPTYSSNNDIYRLKAKLFEMGYYVSFVNESDLKTNVLDDLTMVAVKECCIANGLEYQDCGVMYDTWNAIIGGRIRSVLATPSPAPEEEGYRHIYWGERNDGITRVQQKLQALGFGMNLDPGLYNEALRSAIDEFCRFNGIEYNQGADGSNGISVELQAMLLESDALIPFSTPSPEPTVAVTASPAPAGLDAVRLHFTGSMSVGGLRIPNLVIWIVCLALVVGCIVAVIYFFVPSDDKHAENKSTRRGENTNGEGSIEFIIKYGDSVQRYRCDIERQSLLIGRGVGSFPLNMEDRGISRKHCEIYYLNRSLMLRDYSSNGTRVNNRPCSHSELLLSSGDVIEIGDHQITILFRT